MGEICKVVSKAVVRAKHAMRSDDMFFYRTARWLLKHCKREMVETDKDDGYAFMKSAILGDAARAIHQSGDYSSL